MVRVRLSSLAKDRTAKSKAEAIAKINEQKARLSELYDMASTDEITDWLKGRIREFTPEYADMLISLDRMENAYKPILSQVYQYKRDFTYTHWHVKQTVDPNGSDDANLAGQSIHLWAREGWFGFGRESGLTYDLIVILGKIARKIGSLAYPNVVSCMKVFDGRLYLEGLPKDVADAFVADLGEAIVTIRAELKLFDAHELKDILPKRPIEVDSDFGGEHVFFPCDVRDPEKETAESKERVMRNYRRNLGAVMGGGESAEYCEMISECADCINNLADQMEDGCPTMDDELSEFIYDGLYKVLQLKTVVQYMRFFRVDPKERGEDVGEFDGECVDLEMPENEPRKNTVEGLKRLIAAGLRVAKRVKSATKADWERMICILKRHDDEFIGEEALTRSEAMHDLSELIQTLRNARNVLWGEVQSVGGKVRLSKTVKKYKGKKTPFMENQRVTFLAYIKNGHPVTASMKADRRARDCWTNEHKAEWDRAAADGTGYKSYKMLGRAFRNTK